MTAASGVALTSENLVADFGPKTPCARQAICVLCAAQRGDQPSSVAEAFEQWLHLFGQTAGRPLPSARLENKKTFLAFVGRLGLNPNVVEMPKILFAIHTYYALLVKLAAVVAASRTEANPLGKIAASSEDELQIALDRLERGDWFRERGLPDFLERDCFGWYLTAWNRDLGEAIRAMVRGMAGYVPRQLEPDAGDASDLLKKPYQTLVSREVRHQLGEYYTPDWLAEHLLFQTLGEDDLGDASKRVLDPACGSGIFLVILIRHIRARAKHRGHSPADTLNLILRNIVGFDLNPLATLAAKTNYLSALGDLLQAKTGEIRIPIHRMDSITAPPAMDRYDYVVGNPPWINWETLPDEYRRQTKPLWEHHGLFPHGGMDVILGHGKKDLSMLMTYVVLDRYLRDGGRLGFVISESVFKNTGAARGFRRFHLADGTPCGPTAVDDMTALAPFEGAATRTAVLAVTKGQAVQYPVPYRRWFKQKRGRGGALGDNLSHEIAVREKIDCETLQAEPIDEQDPASAWLTGRSGSRKTVQKLRGKSEYVAREGANTGGANAVYWVERATPQDEGKRREFADSLVEVVNVLGRAKRLVPTVRAAVEKSLLYPLVRTADLRRWTADPNIMILLAQDPDERTGIPAAVMAERHPRAHAYLARFEKMLRERAAYRRYFRETDPYWTMFNVGRYTLADWKVAWHRMGHELRAAVCGPIDGRPTIPQETLCFIAAASHREAHYLCAAINSAPFHFAVQSYSQKGGKSFASPHILENLRVPTFDENAPIHGELADFSMKAHRSAAVGDAAEVGAAELEIDRAAASLWRLSAAESAAIRGSLHSKPM